MNVGYQLLPDTGLFIQITNQAELEEVDSAASKEDNASEHIKKAIILFSDRKSPDYVNTVKEAISAVESFLIQMTEERDLGKALAKMKKDNNLLLHPSLSEGINKLYGFASDTVRHGKKDGDVPTNQHTARLILILCSALVNYIRALKTDSQK